jgi:hypothetical protein
VNTPFPLLYFCAKTHYINFLWGIWTGTYDRVMQAE